MDKILHPPRMVIIHDYPIIHRVLTIPGGWLDFSHQQYGAPINGRKINGFDWGVKPHRGWMLQRILRLG